MEKFISNLLGFALERDHSGRGGRGGLGLESSLCGFPSKSAKEQKLYF